MEFTWTKIYVMEFTWTKSSQNTKNKENKKGV